MFGRKSPYSACKVTQRVEIGRRFELPIKRGVAGKLRVRYDVDDRDILDTEIIQRSRQMLRRTTIASFIAALLILSFGTAWGRLIESWPYDKLFKNAELVIIAKAVSVRDANNADKANPPRDYLVGVVTTLEVEHVVKGEYKDQRLELVHFRLKEGSRIMNGPLLVEFHTKPQTLRGYGWAASIEPEYMLFLKKSKDGRFECVSGQFDPQLSVKQILDPLP